MAWPPPVQAINRTDATPQQTTHAADHNAHGLAINDIVAQINALLAPVQWQARQLSVSNLVLTTTKAPVTGALLGSPVAYPRMMFVTVGLLLSRVAGSDPGVDCYVQAPAGVTGLQFRRRCDFIGSQVSISHSSFLFVPPTVAPGADVYLAATTNTCTVSALGSSDLNFIEVALVPALGNFVNLPGTATAAADRTEPVEQ
jgi:hypothetical protein